MHTGMHTILRQTYGCVCVHSETYVCTYIHGVMYAKYIHTDTHVCLQTCMHTYITHTFQLRNVHNFRV